MKKLLLISLLVIILVSTGIFFYLNKDSSQANNLGEATPSLTGTQKYTIMENVGRYIYLDGYSQYGYLGRDYHKAIYSFEGENVSVFVNIFNSIDAKEDYKGRLLSRYTEENNLTGTIFYQQNTSYIKQ